MILVVYVAAALVAFREGRHALGRRDYGEITALLLLAPIGFVLLSAAALRPGPHRDWIAASFVSLSALPIILVLFAAPLAVPLVMQVPAGRSLGLCLAPTLIFCPFYASGGMGLLREHLFPERCPRCGRKSLIRSFHRLLPKRFSSGYYQCGVCDAQHLLRAPGSACPKCGRHTLMRRRYLFAWCVSCKGRYKRFRRHPWEDASGADDGGFYWLWDPIGRLEALRSHIWRFPT
jgi:hypothetical protein